MEQCSVRERSRGGKIIGFASSDDSSSCTNAKLHAAYCSEVLQYCTNAKLCCILHTNTSYVVQPILVVTVVVKLAEIHFGLQCRAQITLPCTTINCKIKLKLTAAEALCTVHSEACTVYCAQSTVQCTEYTAKLRGKSKFQNCTLFQRRTLQQKLAVCINLARRERSQDGGGGGGY